MEYNINTVNGGIFTSYCIMTVGLYCKRCNEQFSYSYESSKQHKSPEYCMQCQFIAMKLALAHVVDDNPCECNGNGHCFVCEAEKALEIAGGKEVV